VAGGTKFLFLASMASALVSVSTLDWTSISSSDLLPVLEALTGEGESKR